MNSEFNHAEQIVWKCVNLGSWIALVANGLKIFSDISYDTAIASAMELSLSQSANFLLEGTANDPLRWMSILIFFLAGAGILQSNKMINLLNTTSNVE